MNVREKTASEKRLIDANALLRHKRKMSGADFGGEFWDEAVLASDIKNAPTVDAVEVVRCLECDHKTHDGSGRPYCWRLKMYLNKELDFFCKYGERKEGVN